MPRTRLDWLLETALPSLRLDPRPDAELLARFLNDRDEAAFEALLVRHAPGVRATCRAWLRSPADIDDAAQATFLVLVQRAGSIRNRAALGPWLYGVAANVARRLRRQRPAFAPLPADVAGREPAGDDALRDLLAEEVARLPEKYRLPVQLCYWAGLTTTEAAGRLGWPRGTVLTRLAWARKRLQQCLARRGLAPAAGAGLLTGAAAPAVSAQWVSGLARAAAGLRAGKSPASAGVSELVISLTEGVVRAMMWDRLKYVAVAAVLALGLAGYGVHQWVSASDSRPHRGQAVVAEGGHPGARDEEPADGPAVQADGGRAVLPVRRREAVIRLPAGTFVKEVEAAPYGSGRLTWTYEEERVVGLVEGSVLGVEFELATEAEYSLSSNGTIYGLVTSARLNHLRLPDGEKFAELKPFVGLWPAVEPLANEVLEDLPFSYRFRVQGDRLVISNFRILLAGPNPLGKVGALTAQSKEFAVLAYFQALGTALEGTYTRAEPGDRRDPPRRSQSLKSAPVKRPLFLKPPVQQAPRSRTP